MLSEPTYGYIPWTVFLKDIGYEYLFLQTDPAFECMCAYVHINFLENQSLCLQRLEEEERLVCIPKILWSALGKTLYSI